ncbi:hypothetical protein STEG23_035013 [Scotinomys teguina]
MRPVPVHRDPALKARAERGARARTPPAAIGQRRSHSELTRQGSRSLAPPASFSPRLARKAGNVELEQRTPRSTATRDSVPPHAKPREPTCSEVGFMSPHARAAASLSTESPRIRSRDPLLTAGKRCPRSRGGRRSLPAGHPS